VNGWQTRSLGELSTINYGYTEKANWSAVGPRFLRITDIQSGGVDWASVPFCPISNRDKTQFELKSGEIVFARTGATTGKSFLIVDPPEAVFASYLIRLRISDKNLLPEFVSYFFQTKGYWDSITFGIAGSAQGGFNASKLADMRLSFPRPSEQRRIVSILDEAFAGLDAVRGHAEKGLQNARELFQSHVDGIFLRKGPHWLHKTFGDICDIKHGFAFKSEFFTGEGQYVLLTPGNFFESGGYRDRGEKQKFYVGEIPNGYILSEGDLLVVMTEQAAGLLGSPALIPESGRFLHNQRLGLVSPKSSIPWVNELFFHVFNTRAVRSAIHESGTGTKVRHTSPTKIGEVRVSFPASMVEQVAIVRNLTALKEKADDLASVYTRKLAAIAELKQSLLQKAFSGQLAASESLAA